MTTSIYHPINNNHNFVIDAAQLSVIKELQHVHDRLLGEHKKRLRFRHFRRRRLIDGIYLYGGVGIGKTFLLDCFYRSLPFEEKMRMHFFQFMAYIHTELNHYAGRKNPLVIVAKKLAAQVDVICIDEFFVKDIVDAMLLRNLLTALYAEGICLLFTSNVAPDELYKNGLQRQAFLPAIAALKQHAKIIHMPTKQDYRLLSTKIKQTFFTPTGMLAEAQMRELFKIVMREKNISAAAKIDKTTITIADRSIVVRHKAGRVIWFEFDKICRVPRSQADYLELAKDYDVIFISDIPVITAADKNTIRLFIAMVDVFYDARKKLILSAAAPINEIYIAGDMLFEYARTSSRLTEMQSADYLQSDTLKQTG